MKASIVTEITHVISASLTSTAKPDAMGVERHVHWCGLGILANKDKADDMPPDSLNDETVLVACKIYDSLSRHLPLSFVTTGIHFHPLKHNSWVLVSFTNKVWLGNGKWKYEHMYTIVF